jgi:hypothetical protein
MRGTGSKIEHMRAIFKTWNLNCFAQEQREEMVYNYLILPGRASAAEAAANKGGSSSPTTRYHYFEFRLVWRVGPDGKRGTWTGAEDEDNVDD